MAVVHCEHTVQTGPLLRQMRLRYELGDLATPKDLLDFFFSYAVVSVLLQEERFGRYAGIDLGRKREFNGRFSSWAHDHPEFPPALVADDRAKPFVRYVGTGLQIVFVPTGELIDLERDTIAAHRARVAAYHVYQASSYF